MKKLLNWVICIMLLTGCQGIGVVGTPVDTIQTEALSPAVTLTSLPSHTLTPSPTTAPVTQTSTPAPMERLAFTVATNVGGMYPDTIIAFANSDGAGFETPSLFEPFRYTGGVSGKHLVWSPNGRYLAFDGADKMFGCGPDTGDCFYTNYGIISKVRGKQVNRTAPA